MPYTVPDSPPPHIQSQSPLFSRLPAELRDLIFTLCLSQYEDRSAAYPENEFWLRPGYTAPRVSSSALLRTCKRAYTECHNTFVEEAEQMFWFQAGPLRHRSGQVFTTAWFKNLSQETANTIHSVRFFFGIAGLDNPSLIQLLLAQKKFRAKRLTLTLRWDGLSPLPMSSLWLERFMGNPELRVLKVEYEFPVEKVGEMMVLVERNKSMKLLVKARNRGFTPEFSGWLDASETNLREWIWNGVREGEEGLVWAVVECTWEYVAKPEGWRTLWEKD